MGRSGGPATEPAEGLAWLGREPSARVPLILRVSAALARFVAYRLLGATYRVEGREHTPTAPFIAAAAIHRSWLDGLALGEVFPLEPRIWYIASGIAAFKTPMRRRYLRAIGGILPVYRGGFSIDSSVASARAVQRAGAILGFFPEGTRRGPPDDIGPFRGGIGYLALRTGMPVLPVALAGTKELYLGKRLAARVLPPFDPLTFAGLAAAPAEGSREERDAAHRITDGLRELLRPHVQELVAWTTDPPGKPRRLEWLTRLFP